MENEVNGLADSFVARHTTDVALFLELLSRNQNGSCYDQGTEIGAEIAESWNVESLEFTNNSPLALVQGVARATIQMNRVMREREQRELERVHLQTDQDRSKTEIRTRRNREMRERERSEMRRSIGWRKWQEAVPGPWCSCSLDEFVGDTICRRCNRQSYLERNSVVTNAEENSDQRFGPSGGSVTNRNYDSSLLDLEQRVERVSRDQREREEFTREIERKEQEIRAERARKKREREARELPEISMWRQQPFPASLCNFDEQGEENLRGEGSGRQRKEEKPKCCPQSGQDECCICLENAFSGCQILPCSHKVHKECAIAMIQNGVRSCPICHQPFGSAEYTSRQTGNHN